MKLVRGKYGSEQVSSWSNRWKRIRDGKGEEVELESVMGFLSSSSRAFPCSKELVQIQRTSILALPVSFPSSPLAEKAQDESENDQFGSFFPTRPRSLSSFPFHLPSLSALSEIRLYSQDLGFPPCCSISSSVLLSWITVEETCPYVEGMSWMLIQRVLERREGRNVERRGRRKVGRHRARGLHDRERGKGREEDIERMGV